MQGRHVCVTCILADWATINSCRVVLYSETTLTVQSLTLSTGLTASTLTNCTEGLPRGHYHVKAYDTTNTSVSNHAVMRYLYLDVAAPQGSKHSNCMELSEIVCIFQLPNKQPPWPHQHLLHYNIYSHLLLSYVSALESQLLLYIHLHGAHCASLYSQYTAAPTTVAPTAAEMMLGVVPFATSIVGIILLSIVVLLLAVFTTCMYYRRSHHRPGSYYVIELSTAHKTIQLHVKQSLFL